METVENPQKHADRIEYDLIAASIQNGELEPGEKDTLRKLLTAGFCNLNGDPIEKKVQNLARVDWEQIKLRIGDAKKLNTILRVVEELRAEAKDAKEKPAPETAKPATKFERILAFVEKCRNQIAATAIGAFCAPHGPEVVQKICDAFK